MFQRIRSRVGWPVLVAVALLTLAGGLLAVNFMGGEKKIERRIVRQFAVDDPRFRHELGVMLGPPFLDGAAYRALHNGDLIFPAMLAAIRSAKSSITFETYIYWSGGIGREFTAALTERARSGVKTHVLLDRVGSAKIDAALIDSMQSAGVQVHKFHPPHWSNLGRLNNRTHRKLLVVDGLVAFTGGVGIAPNWTGSAQDPEHWRDSHFEVRGPVVAQMQAVFLDNWTKATGNVLHGSDYFPTLPPAGTGTAQMFSSSPNGGSESMQLMYLLSITAAARSIDLAAAYFVPDELSSNALVEAMRRGVAWRRGAHHRSRRTHRQRHRAWCFTRPLGPAAQGRRADRRVPTDDVPLQGDDHRLTIGLGWIDQLRQPLVSPE